MTQANSALGDVRRPGVDVGHRCREQARGRPYGGLMRRVVAIGLALFGLLAVVSVVFLTLAVLAWDRMYPGFIG